MNRSGLDPQEFRRRARERAAEEHVVRISSALNVHGPLRSSLRTGLLGEHDRLDEAALVKSHSVSRNAVRAALGALVDEGLVSRTPRNGTVVLDDFTDVPIDNGIGWAVAEYSRHDSVELESRWIRSTPITRAMLHTEEPWVYAVDLLDLRNGEPRMIYTRYTLSDGAARPTISGALGDRFEAVFAQVYGSPLADIDCWIDTTPADERVAAMLSIPTGTPLLVKQRLLWSADGVPREFSISHYVATRVSLTTVTSFSADRAPARCAKFSARALPRTDAVAEAPEEDEVAPRHHSSEAHAQLRTAIRTGLLSLGARLEENELADRLGTSRNAIRTALATMVDEGLVCRSRRYGTLVTAPVIEVTLDNGTGWDPRETNRHATRSIGDSAMIPTPPVLARLMSTDSPTIRVDQVLCLRDGAPFSVYLRYAVPSTTPLRPFTTEVTTPFEQLFESAYGTTVSRIETSVQAVRADEQTARLLGVPTGTALLLKERLLEGADGVAHEFSHTYYVAARVTLSTHSPVAAPSPVER